MAYGDDPIQGAVAPAQTGGYGNDPVVGQGQWKVSDQALTDARKYRSGSVVYMKPDQYLALVPPIKDQNDKKGSDLAQSLADGNEVQEIPSLDMDKSGKVIDQDGRHRAQFAKDAGVDLIPVLVKKPRGAAPAEITGMTGSTLPYDFKPVDVPQAPKQMTKIERFGTGVKDPIQGAAQALTHALPDAVLDAGNRANNWLRAQGLPLAEMPTSDNAKDLTLDSQTRGREQEIKAESPQGFDWWRLGGNIVSPVNLAVPARALGGGNMLRAIGSAAIQGAGLAANQPVTGEGFWDQKAGQIGTGAALGAITPPIVYGVTKATSPVVDPLIRFVTGVKGPTAVKDAAVQEIMRRVDQDTRGGGAGAQDIIDLLNSAPTKPLTLADVAGENVRALAGRLSRIPGESRQIIEDFFKARDLDAGLRVTEDVNKALGGKTAFDAEKALTEARAKAAAPLYDEAYKANQDMASPKLDRILKTPAGKSALAAARVKMQNDMALLARPDAELTEAMRDAVEYGNMKPIKFGVSKGLKLRTWDYVKRALDDQIGTKLRSGEKDDARILIGMKNDLVKALDDADVTGKAGPNSLKPEGGAYARARAAYSGPTQSMEALENGKSFMNKDPQEIAEEMSNLSKGDKEFYKLGAATALRKSIAKTGAAGDEARKVVGNSYIRQQLRPLFDSDKAYDRFINSLTAESRMFATGTEILKNSPTAKRLVEDQSPESEAFANAGKGAISAAHGNWLGAITNFLRAANDLSHRGDPAQNAAMARLLTAPLASGSPGMRLLAEFAQQAPQTKNYLLKYASPAARVIEPPAVVYGTSQ